MEQAFREEVFEVVEELGREGQRFYNTGIVVELLDAQKVFIIVTDSHKESLLVDVKLDYLVKSEIFFDGRQ